MSVNKNIFIVFIILFLVFVPHTINAFTVTSGDKISAGSGDWKTWARKKYDSNGNLLICSQHNKPVPTECDGTIKTLDDEVAAGLSVIVNSKINYVCQQLLIDKFLYNYYDPTGRANQSIVQSISQNKKNKNWVASCTNAKTVYDSAIAKKEEVEAVYDQTLEYSASSLDFTYNSSTGQYESTVTVSGVNNYECSVDNGATVSYPSYYEVKVSVSSNNVSNTTTLTCKPRIDIHKPTYYYCGTDVQDLITSSMSYEYTYGSPQQISGKRSGSLTINYHSNYATEAFSGALNPVAGDRDVIVGQWIVYSNTQFPTGGDSLHSYKKYNDVYPSMYLARTGYNATGFWNTKADGTGISIDQTRDFTTPQELASAFGKDISASDQVVDVYAQWEKQVGTLKIKKVKQDGTDPVLNKNVTFDVYPNDSCTGTPIEWDFYSGGDGWDEIELNANSEYSIKEKVPPEGYGISGQCIHVGYMTDGGELSQIITNKTQCEFDFEKDSSIKNRLKLYKDHNHKYRNLLNFNITEASEACTTYEPKYYLNNSCRSIELEYENEKDFNIPLDYKFGKGFLPDKQPNIDLSQYSTDLSDYVGDLSSYNATITKNNFISYCLVEFHLDNLFVGKINNSVSAGQLVVKLKPTDDLAYGFLSKRCYIYKDDYLNYNIKEDDYPTYNIKEDYFNVEEYIGDFFVDGGKVVQKNGEISLKKTELKYFYEVVWSVNIKYRPNPVYVEKITGKSLLEKNNEGIILRDNCVDSNGNLKNNCRLLGYGIASNFNDGLESNFKLYNGIEGYHSSFEVSIKNGTNNIFDFGGDDFCPYRVVPKIIKYPDDKGNLQLEFRTIDTNNPFNRDPKTNWAGTNIVQQYITNSNVNNSYNRTGEGSLYQINGTGKIILTPDLVKQIREYNDENPYNDYTVHIETDEDGTETTTTDFFDYIGITKVQ